MQRISTVAWVLVLVTSALAGSISMTTTQHARLENGVLTVEVTMGNSGDEAAHSVSPVLRFRDAEVRGKRHESLSPGAKVSDSLNLDVGDLSPGRWIFSLAVDYTDANQYPFQALQIGNVVLGNLGPAKVSVASITSEPVSTEVPMTVTVKNLSADARTVELRLHVPDGLEVPEATRDVAVAGWEEKVVDLKLINRTALPGSRYPIFASAEYDLDDGHYSVVGQGMIEVTKEVNAVERHGENFQTIALALAGLFVLLVGSRLLRR